MLERFVIYGLAGWCMEIIWTGFQSILAKDPALKCNTSIWMFPIYGLAVFFEPLLMVAMDLPLLIRGLIYVFCIFAAEYATGWAIKRTVGVCPWDYSGNKYSVKGLIRLDYAPVWFAAGLIFERIHSFVTTM